MSTNWGDLDDTEVEAIKRTISRAVADGVGQAIQPEKIAEATADGIMIGMRRVAEDDALFDAIMGHMSVALRRSAQRASGRVVWDAITGLLRKALWFMIGGILVYSIGGWSAVAALWQTLTGHPAPK